MSATIPYPHWGDLSDLVRLMDVRRIGDGRFEAPAYRETYRNVIEAGQIMGAKIVAAARSVPDKRVTSIHTVFARPAGFDRPLGIRTALPRNGRSFATAAVEAEQDGKSVASSLILLDKGAPDLIRGAAAMPRVPGPEDCPPFDFGMTGREIRFVDGAYDADPERVGPPEIHAWVKCREQPAELALRQALLAQVTGHMTIAAAMAPHTGIGEAQAHVSIATGVLAVTLAFHDDPDVDGWVLYSNPAIFAGRGLAQGQGRVFAADGRMLASYTVQAMIRGFEAEPAGIAPDSRRM